MKAPSIGRNAFDLSHERKMSLDMGNLIPFMVEEVMPGDFFKARSSFVVRITPLLAPLMHRVDVTTHFFFVPLRLIWTNFESFITGGAAGTDATVWPYIEFGSVAFESLADYMGVSPRLSSAASSATSIAYDANVPVSALPFRAYNLIYNEWYRDETQQSLIALSKGDGADATTSVALLKRCWEKDRFTSALPWQQRGTAVSMPLGTSAPILPVGTTAMPFRRAGGTTVAAGAPGISGSGALNDGTAELWLDPTGKYYADLSTATASTINALRYAFQVQKWMERNARGGARYVESNLAHFGVRSSDARLQRPEFLGGGRSPVVVSEVVQTSETGTTPQGTMAGHAFSVQNAHAFSKGFEEHGLVIGIVSVMPRTGYYQGLPKMFSRTSRYDYPWPEFMHLGEEAVLSKEIFLDGSANDSTVFGYQPRYDELRRRESSVHGKFRAAYNYWHMCRNFGTTRPTLNAAFVEADPTKRINAVTTEPNVYMQVYNDLMAVRPMPVEGTPGGI